VPAALASDLDGLVFDQVAAAFGTNGKVTIPSAAAQLLLVVNAKGSAWHLTDLTKMRHYQLRKKGDQIEVSVMPQFYFASVATAIGGVRFPQGYYVNGALNFAGFKAEATIDIATGRGVSVEAKMDRIVIGNESLFSIQAEQGGGGPVVSISTFSQQDNPVKEFRLPHFYVNGQLSMLGVKEKVFASLTTKGLALEVSGQVAPAVHLDVRATAGGSGLDLGGQVKVGVGTIDLGALGKIKVNTDLEGSMGITADAKKIDAWVEASCKFMGKGIQLGRAKLDTSPDAIARLAETMAKKVEAELRKLFADAEQWANAMKNGLVDGVQDTAKVFRDVYGKSAQVATQMANDVAKGMTGAANAVAKGATDAANTVAKGTTQAANTVASGAKDVTKDAGHEASKDYKKAKKWISKL
ncbi:MAG TPA: hypothetical protein VND93_27240, partial [Myxococcales bacterium]|nr:hypothetical protein [Myxococcales bacterium]